LSGDELAALADDIKANGLRHPIVTWTDSKGQTWLIDGRNRLAACEIAGIEPAFKAFDGDPVAYITSEGFRRRDLNDGKRAIVAVRSPLYKLYGHTELAAVAGVPRPRIAEAAIIVQHGGELADEVLADRVPFHIALQDSRKRRADKLERERRDGELRAEAPDLISLVADEVLTFDEACAAYDKRTEDVRREQSEHAAAVRRQAERVMAFLDGVDAASGLGDNPMRDDVLNQLGDHDRDRFLRIEKELAWPTTGI
jgi:hypothetical protein